MKEECSAEEREKERKKWYQNNFLFLNIELIKSDLFGAVDLSARGCVLLRHVAAERWTLAPDFISIKRSEAKTAQNANISTNYKVIIIHQQQRRRRRQLASERSSNTYDDVGRAQSQAICHWMPKGIFLSSFSRQNTQRRQRAVVLSVPRPHPWRWVNWAIRVTSNSLRSR